MLKQYTNEEFFFFIYYVYVSTPIMESEHGHSVISK